MKGLEIRVLLVHSVEGFRRAEKKNVRGEGEKVARIVSTNEGPSEEHSMLVLGAVCSFLDPFGDNVGGEDSWGIVNLIRPPKNMNNPRRFYIVYRQVF